jgi:arylsulfatase A-like enzyme
MNATRISRVLSRQRAHPGLALIMMALAVSACQTEERPPNLVILFSDDAGYADFGFQGSSDVETPNLDQLAASGIRFTDGYVSASVCAPSRAGLLTGRYQQRFGFEYNLPGARDASIPDSVRGLPLSETTIADELGRLGYATGLVGKWHQGLDDRFHPLNRGFDEFFGMRAGSSGYMAGRARAIENGFEPVPPESMGYLTDEFGDRAVDFVTRHKDEPFFLFLSFNAPHTPMQARPDYLAEALPRFSTAVRAANTAMTRSLDDNVGKVIEVLRDLDLEDNTLVVFVNDNGGAMPYNGSHNAPLRGAKGTVLEGGVRVPFLISWPGTLEAGSVFDAPVSTLDLLPTFVAVAGGQPIRTDLDGVDLMPFIGSPDSVGVPHDTLYWKLNWGAALRAGHWKLVRTPADEYQLFDLQKDVAERTDLSSSEPERLARMVGALERWETGMPDPIWVSEPMWREHSLRRYDQTVVDGFVRR